VIRISGNTRVLVVIGDPIQHSLSPSMHNAAITALGLDAVYVPLRTTAVALPHVMRAFEASGVGGNITVPHKVAAASLIVRVTDTAKQLGALNTFWRDGDRLVGDNTDVAGILDALARLDAPGPWLIAGTGGSARAVAAAARETSTTLLVRSREMNRARDFVSWAKALRVHAQVDDGSQVGTAINTTPLGLRSGDEDPFPVERLDGCLAALDLVYAAGGTRWCQTCRSLGMRASDGRVVLVGQGVGAFERFFPDTKAPRAVMEGVIEQCLRS